MRSLTLKDFQNEAVDSGVALFSAAKELLDAAGGNRERREKAIGHNGYLLVEAPTGSGKTLMAGTIVERFSAVEDVVWFWFAPFKGVTGQTTASLREQFHGLRLRELSDDRAAEMCRGGDVFVTTWQSVAARSKESRNIRRDGDMNPSIDTLVDSLRLQGMRIGVVVDEAHHGFGKGTQASEFFHEILRPEYTVLITATPDDKEIKHFEKAMRIPELQRIRVSRPDAVQAGLIKMGVKCAAYFVEPDKRSLVDLEATALRDGVAAHRQIKRKLEELNIPLVPLMLVQADSKKGSIEKLKGKLVKMGFSEDQIAVHTAKEPDADLLALANDEQREVLIFKMAVALGFDAPRAFTLVSMRASRDPDFGVQLVGRILRVHRRLQSKSPKNLPDELNFGYVFLADAEMQEGLDLAGQRINAIQTEYAKASSSTVVMRIGEQVSVSDVDKSGQVNFALQMEDRRSESYPTEPPPDEKTDRGRGFDLKGFFDGDVHSEKPGVDYGSRTVEKAGKAGVYRYALRDNMPRCFKTQTVCAENEVTEEDCAQRFVVDTRDLFEALKNRVPVEKRTLDVFTHEIQQEMNFSADLSPEQASREAQKVLLKNKTFDPRELRKALLKKLASVMREEAMAEAEHPDQVAYFLDVILATHRELLYEAQKKAHAVHAEISEAEELPAELAWAEPLPTSPRNVYGILPPGLNNWERAFSEMLDSDSNNIVSWWHRNEPRKPWSVNVLMPDGRGFYPDFVIGIEGRSREDGVLLADPKMGYARAEEAPKILAEHGVYGRVLILFKDGVRWMTVGYDEKARKPIVEREFRLADAPGF